MKPGFWRPKVADEVKDELEFHLEMRIRELMAAGMTREQARAAAEARLGDLGTMRRRLARLGEERNRKTRRREWLAELTQDVRYASRALRQQPGFALAALVTLAVGIGATTAIFSVLYAVVLRPLPIPELDRVMVIADGNARGGPWSVSSGNYGDYRRDNRSFVDLGAIYWGSFNLSLDGAPERVAGARVDRGFFSVMRMAPTLGRTFTADEDEAGAAQVVVLSERLWRRRFGADSAVLGRAITLNGIGAVVVGIMPRAFGWGGEELWVPAAFTAEQLAEHDAHFLSVYGRLKPGVTPGQSLADLDRIARRLAEAYPDANDGLEGWQQPMFEQFVGNAPNRLGILIGAVAAVLLIGCVNVANLLLARGAARERELAVRAALGAGRRRIIRQLVTENLVLALVGGTAGVGLAALVVKAIVASTPSGLPRIDEATIDLPVLVFALGLSLATTLLFGVVPALRAARPSVTQALREGAKGSSLPAQDWLRRGLVAAEVGLALVLLVGAGLLIRTAAYLGRVDPGFEPRGVLTAQISLPRDGYPDWERSTSAFGRIRDELAQIPGVEGAALASQVPLGPGGGDNGIVPEGRPLAMESAIGSRFRLVTPGYLGVMKIPLKRGRDFTSADRAGAPRVMIVNERLAELAWPDQDPIGKRVVCCEGTKQDPMWKEIIGVAGDVRWNGLGQAAGPEFYLPIEQTPADGWNWVQRTMTLVVRGRDPAGLVGGLRAATAAVDPTVPVYAIATMDERIAGSLSQSRFNTGILTTLGVIGLILAGIGIYGVVAYFVARRTRELGIRLALGASAGQIRSLVLKQGLAPVGLGIVAGTVVGLAAARLLTAQLRGIGPNDPVTFATVASFLTGIAALAILVPARRATRIDATAAMREE